MEKQKFMTEKEKAKSQRNLAIRSEYERLQKENPMVSKHRLHLLLAEKFGINHNTIYQITR